MSRTEDCAVHLTASSSIPYAQNLRETPRPFPANKRGQQIEKNGLSSLQNNLLASLNLLEKNGQINEEI
jgi:hypothetical protein